jgi:hypothetical protein
MSKFVSSIARIAKYRLIRSVIRGIVDGVKEGAENFYNFSKASSDSLIGYSTAVDKVKSATQVMKNQIGSAFGSLYAAIAPIILKLIDIATKLANVLTMLFARLGGAKGWYKAADGANAAADAAAGAGAAAKEAMKYLAPFDELNRLPSDNKSGGGGGGGSSGSSGGDYEWVPFEEYDIAQGIKDFVGQIQDAFRNVADWFEGINWQQMGTDLWNGFKEVIGGVDWAGLADAMFEAFGAAIGAAAGFLKGLAEGVIESLANYFVQFIRDENNDGYFGAGEIINGMLEGVRVALSNIGAWIKEHIFQPFITGFKKAFGIESPAKEMIGPGEMIAQGILEGIKAPFEAIGAWLKEYVVKPIKDFFTGDIDINGITLPIQTDLSGFQLPDLKAFKKAWDGIKNKTAKLTAKLAGTKESVFKTLASKWETIKTKSAELTASLKNNVKEGVLDKLRDGWNALKDKTATFTANLKNNTIVQKFIDAWNSLKDKTLELKIGIQDKIKSAWNAAARAWNSSAILSKLGTLPYLANGGILNGNGQLFVAGEKGPEMVGRYGNQTGVMNNQQIVDAVSRGVANAIASIRFTLNNIPSITGFGGGMDEESMYRAMLRALTDADFGENVTEVNLDGNVLYREVVRRNRNNTRMTGVNALA